MTKIIYNHKSTNLQSKLVQLCNTQHDSLLDCDIFIIQHKSQSILHFAQQLNVFLAARLEQSDYKYMYTSVIEMILMIIIDGTAANGKIQAFDYVCIMFKQTLTLQKCPIIVWDNFDSVYE